MRSGSDVTTCKMIGKWSARGTISVCELASELLDIESLPSQDRYRMFLNLLLSRVYV